MNRKNSGNAAATSRARAPRAPRLRTLAWTLFAAALFLLLNGCVVGLIYTHVIEPLDVNADRTEIVPGSGEGDVKQIRYSLVDVSWNSNAIGDIARREGIETVYYADLETLSVLLGIWRQRTVHIYGSN